MMIALMSYSGCHDVDPAAAPDVESEFIDLYLDDGLSVCGGQMESYDAFVSRAIEIYGGNELDAKLRIPVRTLNDAEDLPCGGPTACALQETAWLSQELGQYHELVHVLQGMLDGRGNRALEEGTAEAIGPLAPAAYVPAPPEGLSPEFLFQRKPTGSDYIPAATFVRFLIDTWGAEAYREFFRATAGASEVQFRSQFHSVFDTDFDEAWSQFGVEPRCVYDEWFCRDKHNPGASLPVVVDRLDCDDDDVLGFSSNRIRDSAVATFQMQKIIRFRIDVSTRVSLLLSHSSGYLGRCGGCAEQIPVILLASQDRNGASATPVELKLEPGEYVMIFRGHEGEGSSLRIDSIQD